VNALLGLDAFLLLVSCDDRDFLLFAASSLATLCHEGPDSNNGDHDADCRKDYRLAEEGVEKLVFEGRLFVCTGGVHLFDIHLQVGVGMRSGQLFEPLVTS